MDPVSESIQSKEWFRRAFDRDLEIWMFPNLVERLRGTPSRLEERIQSLDSNLLVRRDGSRWSIQENAGHLSDLEELWSGRIDDFMVGKAEMRPADLQNTKTHEADHNSRAVSDVLKEFRADRMALVKELGDFGPETVARTALHPRLQQPMRVIDLVFFVAEHDDHHLARITELIRRFA